MKSGKVQGKKKTSKSKSKSKPKRMKTFNSS